MLICIDTIIGKIRLMGYSNLNEYAGKYNKLHISCLALWKRYFAVVLPPVYTPTNRSHGHVVKTDDMVFCLKLSFTSHREIWKVPRRRGPEAFPPSQICIFNPQPSPDTEPSDGRNTKWRFKGWVGLGDEGGGDWIPRQFESRCQTGVESRFKGAASPMAPGSPQVQSGWGYRGCRRESLRRVYIVSRERGSEGVWWKARLPDQLLRM